MADDEGNGNGDVRPLTHGELKRIRRILQDDYYARRFKTTAKVWTITVGAVSTMVIAIFTAWREIALRLLKH